MKSMACPSRNGLMLGLGSNGSKVAIGDGLFEDASHIIQALSNKDYMENIRLIVSYDHYLR